MNVLQHTKNERNPCLKQNRPDRSYRDTLLTGNKVNPPGGLPDFAKHDEKKLK